MRVLEYELRTFHDDHFLLLSDRQWSFSVIRMYPAKIILSAQMSALNL